LTEYNASGRRPTRRQFLRGGLAVAAVAGAAPVLSACGGGGDEGGTDAGGVVTITMWHGQADQGKETLDKLVADFNASHPKIKVDASSGGVLADSMLQKITTALSSGQYPDVAYIFGPDIASLARSKAVADLSPYTGAASVRWDDFWPAAREAATVDGKPRAFPALVDNLCVAYNKKVFQDAGVQPPAAGWTWDDFIATAKSLTNPGKGVFGTGWPGVGDEDCVWRIWPMVWELGGDVVTADRKAIGFDNDAGIKSLTTINRLGKDKSVYVDTKPGSETLYQLFNNGKVAMVATGPWQLPDFVDNKIDYEVVPLPSFSGKPITIAGPDTWTIFDNGKARVQATVEFISWLTDSAQDIQWAITAGSLPLRTSTVQKPEWTSHVEETVGLKTFSEALAYAKTRPTIRAYPRISQPLGQAIVEMLLDKSTPQDSLRKVAQSANVALQTSG